MLSTEYIMVNRSLNMFKESPSSDLDAISDNYLINPDLELMGVF